MASSPVLRSELVARGWSSERQGLPDPSSFALLAGRDADGNGWTEVVMDRSQSWAWLLWHGFNSVDIIDLHGGTATGYQSLFISCKDPSQNAPHPFVWQSGIPGIPDELLLTPLEASPIEWREGLACESMSVPAAASRLAVALVRDQHDHRPARTSMT